jgi:hypothetical protein
MPRSAAGADATRLLFAAPQAPGAANHTRGPETFRPRDRSALKSAGGAAGDHSARGRRRLHEGEDRRCESRVDDRPAFAEIRRRYQKRDEAIDRPSLLLHRIVDGLVDSFFPILPTSMTARSDAGRRSWVSGVGTELVALAILLAFFRRRGWF